MRMGVRVGVRVSEEGEGRGESEEVAYAGKWVVVTMVGCVWGCELESRCCRWRRGGSQLARTIC